MRNNSTLCIVSLFVIGFFVYAFDLNNILFFDDQHFILDNVFIHEFSWSNIKSLFTENSFAGSGRISDYYRPLLLFSFALNYAVDGISPFGYHLVNNLVHILNGLFVYWIMLLGLKKRWIAFLTALVFVIHPMQSEGVAYVAGRGDLLASLLMLVSLLLWIKVFEDKRRVLYMFCSVGSFALALLSRENAIVLPFLSIVFYIAFITKDTLWPALKKALYFSIPHFILVATYLSLRLTVLDFRNFLNFGNVDPGSIYAQSIFVRLNTFLHVLVEYFRTLFFPTNVHERFYFPVHESFFDWPGWLVFLGLISLFWLIILLYQKKSPHFNIWFFSTGWFCVALAPGSGLIPTNVIIQDHRLYLALIGVFALCFYYLDYFIVYAEKKNRRSVKIWVAMALAAYMVFFSWITIERAIIWGKPVELFQETLRYEGVLEYSPGAHKAYNALGAHYFDRKDFKKAEENFLAAIQISTRAPEPYYNLGFLYQIGPVKDVDKAISYYEKAIKINPAYRVAHLRLSEIYMENGRDLNKAAYHLERVDFIGPRDANVIYNLSLVLHLLGGRDKEALVWIDRGLKQSSGNASGEEAFKELKRQIESSR
jgi:protein O-mannosyl-transferase